jgi:FixJ family two-component response regulator
MAHHAHHPGRIYVVDDDASIRDAFRRLLGAHGHEVICLDGAAALLRALLNGVDAAQEPASCVVLDLRLPEMSGLELQQRLAHHAIHLPLVFVSASADVPCTAQAMRAGAVHFLTKPVDEALLCHAVEEALSIARSRTHRHAQQTQWFARLSTLTLREREVLSLVVRGLLNKQIAGELGTVEKTVKVHRSRVMQKLEVKSVQELVRNAVHLGLEAAQGVQRGHAQRVALA